MNLADAKIGVAGAGLMGTEIALVFALAGHHVRLTDAAPQALAKALARQAEIVAKGIARGAYEESAHAALERVLPAERLEELADCDLVVEAVFESEAVKAGIFASLDAACPSHTVFASNTSSIPISTLARHVSAERRPRFLGAHFFSPATRMALVEVIPGFETDEAVTTGLVELCRQAGKTAIRVKDVAGFAVNRLLNAMLIEAVRLVDEGVAAAEDMDALCKLGLGHPIGPLELMDLVGLDLTLSAQEVLHQAYGERFRPPALLRRKVEAGHVGRRGGRGWVART